MGKSEKSSEFSIELSTRTRAIPNGDKQKLDQFKSSLQENLKKQTEKGSQVDSDSGETAKKDETKPKNLKNVSKEFENLKKDFTNTIFENFIYKVKDQNFLFGFQLDSKTRLDYGSR